MVGTEFLAPKELYQAGVFLVVKTIDGLLRCERAEILTLQLSQRRVSSNDMEGITSLIMIPMLYP